MTLIKKKPGVLGVTKKTSRSASTAAASADTAKISHTFPDGTKFTGTYAQLLKVAATLGYPITGLKNVPTGYYQSSTKGLLKISNMHEIHIRRALAQRAQQYFANIFDKNDSNATFLSKFSDLTSDSKIVELFSELNNR